MAGLNELLERSKKTSGEGRVVRGLADQTGAVSIDYKRRPAYVFPLDYAIGGGIPCNVVTQLFGPPSAGKTTLAYLIARATARTCNVCLRPLLLCKCKDGPKVAKTFLCQVEGRPDPSYLRLLGYDADNELVTAYPEYGEQACTYIEEACKADDCGLVLVDSLAAIIPRTVIEGEYEDMNIGGQAKLLTKLFGRLQNVLVNEYRRGHLVSVVCLNQIRSIIGGGQYAPTEGCPGGYAAKHGPRLSIRVNQLSTEDMDKTTGMKNALRFSASLISPQSKQQLFIMAGKCEYKVVLGDHGDNTPPGTVLDGTTVIKFARDLGILTKVGDVYLLEGTELKFKKLADLEELFRTGQYTNPTTGEVLPYGGMDDVVRFRVLSHAKAVALMRIRELAALRAPVGKIAPGALTDKEADRA